MTTCTIGEAAVRCGLSIDTIRYYDKLGLVVGGRRTSSGRRVFDDDTVRWLVFLRQMRATGMSLANVKTYIEQRGLGADGVDGVIAVLKTHQAAMVRARNDIDECLAVIERKIGKYQALAQSHRPPGPPEI